MENLFGGFGRLLLGVFVIGGFFTYLLFKDVGIVDSRKSQPIAYKSSYSNSETKTEELSDTIATLKAELIQAKKALNESLSIYKELHLEFEQLVSMLNNKDLIIGRQQAELTKSSARIGHLEANLTEKGREVQFLKREVYRLGEDLSIVEKKYETALPLAIRTQQAEHNTKIWQVVMLLVLLLSSLVIYAVLRNKRPGQAGKVIDSKQAFLRGNKDQRA